MNKFASVASSILFAIVFLNCSNNPTQPLSLKEIHGTLTADYHKMAEGSVTVMDSIYYWDISCPWLTINSVVQCIYRANPQANWERAMSQLDFDSCKVRILSYLSGIDPLPGYEYKITGVNQ